MMKQTPLDEFEFQPAAEIRKVEDKKPRKPSGKQASRSGLGVLSLVLAVSLLGLLLFHFQYRKGALAAINTMESANRALEAENAQLLAKLGEVETAMASLNSQYAISKKGKEQLMGTIEDMKSALSQRDKRIESLNTAINQEKKTVSHLETERDTLKQNVADRQKTIAAQKERLEDAVARERELTDQVGDLTNRISVLKRDLEDEGTASKRIVGNLLEKENAIARLTTELNKAKSTLQKIQDENERFRNVQEGDLVPLSDQVIPARPVIHPPVLLERKGIFSKTSGYVLVNALIDTVGRVEKATYLEQHLENVDVHQPIINRALTTVMEWKFTPALYDAEIKVKVWQPVVVPIQQQ